jgi:hypothetical protein
LRKFQLSNRYERYIPAKGLRDFALRIAKSMQPMKPFYNRIIIIAKVESRKPNNPMRMSGGHLLAAGWAAATPLFSSPPEMKKQSDSPLLNIQARHFLYEATELVYIQKFLYDKVFQRFNIIEHIDTTAYNLPL